MRNWSDAVIITDTLKQTGLRARRTPPVACCTSHRDEMRSKLLHVWGHVVHIYSVINHLCFPVSHTGIETSTATIKMNRWMDGWMEGGREIRDKSISKGMWTEEYTSCIMIYDSKAVSYECIYTFGCEAASSCTAAGDLHLGREIMTETRALAIGAELCWRLDPCKYPPVGL